MKKILFFICAVLTTLNIYAYTQDNKCMTEEVDSITITQLPWFANNNWLSGFVDSIEAPFNNSHSRLESNINKTIYQIPVNIVIYDNSSAPNITNAQAEQYINYVNRFFESNDVLIQLYIRCAIKRIGNSSHAIIDDNAEAGIVLVSDNESNCINIHFVNDAPFNGMAKSPWQTIKYTCIVRTLNTVNTTYMNSLAHEIGHTLGLPHTFNKNNCRTNCFQECVSRTRQQENYCLLTAGVRKCEENGDCFCDTDADIEADDDYISSYTCTSVTYKSNASNCKKTDNYGENFFSNGHNNALINIMSYWHGCRTKITKMQRGAMYIYSTKKGVVPLNNNSTSFYSNADIDSYENDNYYQNVSSWDPSVVNIMQINSRQYHLSTIQAVMHAMWTGCIFKTALL